MKKIIRCVFGMFILASVCLLQTGCSNKKEISDEEINNRLAFKATTALSMINKSEDNELALADSIDDDYFQEILNTVDIISSNDNQYIMVDLVSDNSEYAYLQEVSFYDYDQNKYSYKLYYNNINQRNEADDDDEVETIISYDGIVVIDENTFNFDFQASIETEDDEYEMQSKLVIKTSVNSYITVESEFETEDSEAEEEFVYSVVENGMRVINYSLSIENENNKIEIEIEYNGLIIEFEETNIMNEALIKLTVNNQIKYYYRIKNADGTYSYVLKANN